MAKDTIEKCIEQNLKISKNHGIYKGIELDPYNLDMILKNHKLELISCHTSYNGPWTYYFKKKRIYKRTKSDSK